MRINSEFNSVTGYDINVNNKLYFYNNKLDIEIKCYHSDNTKMLNTRG